MFAAKMQLVFLCEFRNDTKQLVSHSLHVLYMQSWAITYHGLLTLVWLVGACSLWVLPDTRKYTLRLTPLICAYALLLILLQYSCFLVLRVPAVAGSFLNDGVNEVLRTIGGHRENPSLPQQPPSHAATSLPHVHQTTPPSRPARASCARARGLCSRAARCPWRTAWLLRSKPTRHSPATSPISPLCWASIRSLIWNSSRSQRRFVLIFPHINLQYEYEQIYLP